MHPNKTVRLSSDHIYLIGDLHLGDGTRSDAFCLGDSVTKRDRLRSLIQEVKRTDGHLVITGDLMDLQQGWSIDRVITANAILFRELSDLGKSGKLTYVWSELDEDLSYYKELLNAQTASTVEVVLGGLNQATTADSEGTANPDAAQETKESNTVEVETSTDTNDVASTEDNRPVWVEVVQGFRFNPTISQETLNLRNKSLHHLIERLLGTWIRFPLENFPTLENKVFFWLLHKTSILSRWLGDSNKIGRKLQQQLKLAYANQVGDPNLVWSELHRQIDAQEYMPTGKVLVMGHSHLPGVVPLQNHSCTLINTGSWLFDAQTVLHLDCTNQTHRLLDWQSKEEIGSEPYAHLTSTNPTEIATRQNSFSHWWSQHYQGWLKFNLSNSEASPGEPS